MSHAAHAIHGLLSQCSDGSLGFASGLVAGFGASVHCLAMCGGIAAAISMRGAPLPAGGAGVLASRAAYLAQAQGARIAVYVALGAAAGLVGTGFAAPDSGAAGLAVLRWLSAAVLVTMGLSIAGWAPLQGLGARLASPLTRRLHLLHRFGAPGLGLVWGLMPCSMVWLMTAYAGLSGSPGRGALIMAGFGLGTVPLLTAAAAGAGAFASLARSAPARIGAGLVLLAFGAASLV